MRYLFKDRELTTITNCLRVAAEQFNAHAKTFRETAKMESVKKGEAWITVAAAEQLAQQFDRQEAEALCLAARLESAEDDADSPGVEIPAGLKLASRFYDRDQCGRPSCARCYRPLTERDERGGYIVSIPAGRGL